MQQRLSESLNFILSGLQDGSMGKRASGMADSCAGWGAVELLGEGTAWGSGPQQKWDTKDHNLALFWIPALFPDLSNCEAPLPPTTATMTSSLPSHNDRLKSGAQRNLFHKAASACRFVTAMRKVRNKTGHLTAHRQHRNSDLGQQPQEARERNVRLSQTLVP